MNLHKHARLSPRGRALLVDRILVQGLRVEEAAHAAAHPACAFDEAGRRSVEDAVWAASPLPYHGFERVFAREMRVTVRADGE